MKHRDFVDFVIGTGFAFMKAHGANGSGRAFNRKENHNGKVMEALDKALNEVIDLIKSLKLPV